MAGKNRISQGISGSIKVSNEICDDDLFSNVENADAISMDDENGAFVNAITMDDENVEKFKKLYGKGRRIKREMLWLLDESGVKTYFDYYLSFAKIIPEPKKNKLNKDWMDDSQQDIQSYPSHGKKNTYPVGRKLEKWRYDNWGTSSEALFYPEDMDMVKLECFLKGEYVFYTLSNPPIKVYEKMAADGLCFKVSWSRVNEFVDKPARGEGWVENGCFQYHVGSMTCSERSDMSRLAYYFANPPVILVKNREHLDQLISELQENIKSELRVSSNDEETSDSLDDVSKYKIALNNVLDLNIFDVSNVTDLSNLFADFDVFPHSEKAKGCKIKLDVSRWNVSNVTKMANLFNRERVKLIGLNRWDMSKVTDCPSNKKP